MVETTKNYRWLAFLLVCLLLFSLTAPVFAQTSQPVTVRIVPEQVQVAVGQTVDVAVEVVDVTDLYAIDVLMGYDPQAVEVVDLDPELDGVQVQLGTLLEPGFVILNLVDNSLGRLRLVMTQLNPATPKSGTGTLVVVRLKGKAPSPNSAVEVLAVQFSSPAGVEIPVSSKVNGQVEVVQTFSGTTNTPIPAQNPGTPMPTPEPPTLAPTSSDQNLFIPTFTPQAPSALLNLPPTAAATLPPTAAPILAPSATALPEPAANPTVEQQAAAIPETNLQPTADPAAPDEPTLTTAVSAEDQTAGDQPASSNSAWIVLVGVGVILAGGVAYTFIRRKTPPKEK